MPREVQLREILVGEQVRSQKLQVWIDANEPMEDRFRFLVLVTIDGLLEEVGFLATEILDDRYVIYQMVILKQFQEQKIGTAVVEAACKLARSKNYDQIYARPGQLEENWTTEDLDRWYRTRGFTSVPGDEPLLFRPCVY